MATPGEARIPAVDGRSARWEQHHAARRELLIATAVALIESGASDLGLAEIAARAGVSRSVAYRQFADRRELDAAVQQHVLAGLTDEIVAALVLEGTIRASLRRVIEAYVGWAAAHPRLHRVADYDTAVGGDGPVQQTVDRIAEAALALLEWTADQVRGERPGPPHELAEPFAHGLIGMVFGTVRHWVHQPETVAGPALLAALLADAVWAQVDVLLRTVGIELDADRPLEEWLP